MNDPRRGALDARLNRLLDDYAARLRGLVASHCARAPGLDPDDVAQEVRIRLWRALARDQSAALPASYIQRVVATVVVDALRRSAVRAAEPLPEDQGRLVDETEGPEQRAVAGTRMDAVRAALGEVAERRRAAVRLHLAGCTAAEVATLCGTSVDAARKLVDRGLEDLREGLRRRGIGGIDV